MSDTRRDFIKKASLGGTGAVFLAGSAIAKPSPQAIDDGDQEDMSDAEFAAVTYEAVEVNLPKLNQGFRSMWPTVAIASLIASNGPAKNLELVRGMFDDDEALFNTTLDSLKDAKDYFETLICVFDSALARVLHGAARLIEEDRS